MFFFSVFFIYKIFISVKAFNGAGMATVATSNGVYLSYISQGITPPQPFSVWDQDSTEGDMYVYMGWQKQTQKSEEKCTKI